MLGDLRDEIWRLRDDGVVPPRSEEEAIVQALQVELKEKNAEIAGITGKYENAVFVLVVILFCLVAGKMFT